MYINVTIDSTLETAQTQENWYINTDLDAHKKQLIIFNQRSLGAVNSKNT